MKALLILSSLLLSAPALAGSWNTVGTAQLPKEIKVINEGVVTTYSTAGIDSSKFGLTDDQNFSMGPSSRCDPYLGKTVEDTVISVDIKNRAQYGKYNVANNEYELIAQGRTGRATLVIEKDANVFGVCQSDSKTLESITIQSEKNVRLEY